MVSVASSTRMLTRRLEAAACFTAFWSASPYSPFAYSHCRYDADRNRWVSDEHVRHPAPEAEDVFTVLLTGDSLALLPTMRERRSVALRGGTEEIGIHTLVVFDCGEQL